MAEVPAIVGGSGSDAAGDGTGMFDQTITDAESPFTGTDPVRTTSDSESDVDVGTFTGLAFNPMAAFIGGTDESGNPNVTDVSPPADIGENLIPGDQTMPSVGIDESNEITETAGQARDVSVNVASDLGLNAIPWERIAVIIGAVLAGIVALNAFARGAGAGVTD